MAAPTGTTILEAETQLTAKRFPGLQIGQSLPHVFFSSGGTITLDATNFPADTLLARSATVPQEFTGKVEDFNVNFSTAGTAVLKIVRLAPNGEILNAIVKGISSSQSGIGSTVFPGQAIGVAIQTAGTGTIESFDLSGAWVFAGDALN